MGTRIVVKSGAPGAVIELARGDIADQATDAIVNAANSALAGGSGVDGAIHRRGGPGIMAETRVRYPEGCATGDAVITGGGGLAAKHVVHTVGPVYRDGRRGEPELLASAYRRSLEVAEAAGCRSVAFPSISTGAYGYPLDDAARIALRTVSEFLQASETITLVRFVLFNEPAFDVFAAAAARLGVSD